jgi:PhnB protein
MMQLNPYLNFNGCCAEAFKFYEQCLGGKIESSMTYGASPMAAETPPEWHHKIMHTQLTIGDLVLMGADSPPDMFEPAKGFSVMLGIDEPTEAERVFHALAENGTIEMPLQQTFWADRFGVLVDQFGTPWMVNCSPQGEP